MQVKRVKQTFWSRLILPSIFSGMRVTLRHMFLKKDTLQYPEEKRKFGDRYRGVPALV
jgi:NADH-quinone oxidoreductase subunit I